MRRWSCLFVHRPLVPYSYENGRIESNEGDWPAKPPIFTGSSSTRKKFGELLFSYTLSLFTLPWEEKRRKGEGRREERRRREGRGRQEKEKASAHFYTFPRSLYSISKFNFILNPLSLLIATCTWACKANFPHVYLSLMYPIAPTISSPKVFCSFLQGKKLLLKAEMLLLKTTIV